MQGGHRAEGAGPKIATAVVNLAIGIAAGTLVGGVAARSASPYGAVSRH